MKPLAIAEIGRPVPRLEGVDKVTGRATYAFEYDVPDAVYAWPVQSRVARGRILSVDTSGALNEPGTIAVLWHGNAPRLVDPASPELAVLQDAEVTYRGQVVALVVAETEEAAREAAAHVSVDYDEQPHDAVLRADHPAAYRPEKVNPDFPADSSIGSLADAMATAPVTIDVTYSTPAEHNNAMEPHASIARWDGDKLEVWDSNQAPAMVAQTVAAAFGIDADQVRLVAAHVGGGFGSKGTARPIVVLAALAAKAVGRPVKLAASRPAMFALTGYRTPTIQRLRLAAEDDGTLLGVGHDTIEQTSRRVEFAEQTGEATRHMYATPNLRVTHRLVRLDVPTPSWMRAPGETPGMYALESAMDELADALDMDPIELRVRNEPGTDPASGQPFSSRHYVDCLRTGAARFGWTDRPRSRRDGRWLIGTGVAGATYPVNVMPASASVRAEPNGRYAISIAAVDIGQGARTVLHQIAADALGVPIDRIRVDLGNSRLPTASVAGGSSATSSWGWAVTKACRRLREQAGHDPAPGAAATAHTSDDLQHLGERARHAYGAHFAEVRVDRDTGEARVERMLGVFAAGRIINPRLARSQFIGGMVMGIGMALREESLIEPRFGDFINHDLADYHVAVHADVPAIEVHWLDEDDDSTPMGNKGIGEIGIVGAAAAVGNAVAAGTGNRIRELPIRPDKLIGQGVGGGGA